MVYLTVGNHHYGNDDIVRTRVISGWSVVEFNPLLPFGALLLELHHLHEALVMRSR